MTNETKGLGATVALVAALGLLQTVRESGEFCCIEINSDYHYVWDLRFVHENWADEKGHIVRNACDHSHDTLAEAIEHFCQWWEAGADDGQTTAYKRTVEWEAFGPTTPTG